MTHARSTLLAAAVLLAAAGAAAFFLSPRQASAPAAVTEISPGATSGGGVADASFYFTTMTHMEGSFKDDKDEDLFIRHVAQIRWAMDLFDEYGAKLTIESEQSFAKANVRWDLNVLEEIVGRGHGVGTHADFGAERKPLGLAALTREFADNKELVDALVGAASNRGVSGGQGPGDWVTAASRAGFGYVDGIVGFAYLSMPESERPEGWTDAAIRSTYYHDNAPEDLARRTHPFWLTDAADFAEDADGTLLVNGGDAGELSSLAEGRSVCAPNCVLDAADVSALRAQLDAALALHDGSRVGKLNVHVPLSLLDEKQEPVLRELLSMLKSYADAGTVVFGTQKDVYDAALAER